MYHDLAKYGHGKPFISECAKSSNEIARLASKNRYGDPTGQKKIITECYLEYVTLSKYFEPIEISEQVSKEYFVTNCQIDTDGQMLFIKISSVNTST